MTDDSNKNNRIGYRYLFDSKGCSLSGREEATISLVVSEKYNVQIYFGPKPQYGIQSVSNYSKYFIPGKPASFGKVEFNKEPNQSSQHGPFFLEIVVSLESNTKASGNEPIRVQAESKKDEFKNIINLIAGIIGIRFHRQFVLELINENVLTWEGEVSSFGYAGPALEILEPQPLNDNGIKYLENIGKKLKTLSHEDAQKYSLIFHWLLRAWHERDILYKFIDLFIPLECVLNMLSDSKMSTEDKHRAKSIRMLIKKHAEERSEELRCFFDRLAQHSRPGLNKSFADFAKAAELPGWEADVEAFPKFNHMRNILLHGADKEIQQNVAVGEKEVRTLSDLVERYVNYFFFKDNNVYQSRWRPERPPVS